MAKLCHQITACTILKTDIGALSVCEEERACLLSLTKGYLLAFRLPIRLGVTAGTRMDREVLLQLSWINGLVAVPNCQHN